MKTLFGLIFAALVVPLAQAADIGAGKELAMGVCAACHGQNGVSVSDTIPNLAAQRPAYLEAQLKAFKEGTRKLPGAVNPAALMNAIANQLSAVTADKQYQPGVNQGECLACHKPLDKV